MTTDLVVARPDDTVVDVARKMAEEGVGSVLIVDEKGTLIGIVTERDIVVRVVAKGLAPKGVLVGEIMTRNPVTIYDDASLSDAAELMKSKGIGHLPVVSRDGRLVGIVTRSDIVRIAPSLIDILFYRQAG
ncbi:MAG: CBS domain-containing protein [Crenarchaeota archaeon]|nr:CBS domain-containing protein [Thermoproteota archaeon]